MLPPMVSPANKATAGSSPTAHTVTKKDSIRFLAVTKDVDIVAYTGYFSLVKTSNEHMRGMSIRDNGDTEYL